MLTDAGNHGNANMANAVRNTTILQCKTME